VKRQVKTSPSRRPAVTRIRGAGEIERFESLVDALSAVMARMPAEAVDREINVWLEKICLALDLDRSAIYERDEPGKQLRVSHTWVRANFPPFPRNFDLKMVKSAADWVFAGNELVWSRPSELPFEWKDVGRFVERYGPQASAIFPMWAGERVIGAASFGRFRSPRQWNGELLNQLALAVRMFGSAIERKQAEAAARLARSELALAQRRSMMGELIASLAHELNQPLGAIVSNLEGLARLRSQDQLHSARAAKALKNAIQDAKRAGEIVRRVRAIFKSERPHQMAIDIPSLVRETIELVGNEAAFRRITLRIEDLPYVSRASGDRIHIQQCILNLLMNAFDATAQIESRPRAVTISVEAEEKGWIQLHVSDNGAGVDPAVRSRLFEPFVTTKANGMGLGLLVTKSIVEGHGGRLWFTPNPDGGTTFTFTLPVANGEEEADVRHSQ
jgi:signal transduction histidine kinase